MNKKVVAILAVGAFAATLAGCATAHKKESPEMLELKNQVSSLEGQLQSKDEEIKVLREQASSSSQVTGTEKSEATSQARQSAEVPAHFTNKQVQTALKNAGYYTGHVDGKMGKETHNAIKAFQKANGLGADGHVGKKTWALLGTYLEKK